MPNKRVLSITAALVMLLTLVFPADFMSVNAAEITPEEFIHDNIIETTAISIYNFTYPNNVSFKMNGRTFYQGIRFNDSNKVASASYDVSEIDSMSFTFGHVDSNGSAGAQLSIYLDGVVYDILPFNVNDPLIEYELPLKDKSVLLFELTRDNYSKSDYAIADISIDSTAPAKTYSVPEYSSAEDFISSSYDISNTATYYDNTSDFNINGRTYSQGVLFNGTSKYSSLSFNVENVNDISFTMGHVDNTDEADAILSIYADGILYEEVELWCGMKWKKYGLNTSGMSNIQFVLTRSNYSDSQYALADITVDGIEPASAYTVPEYSSSENFLVNNYDNFKCEIYNSTSKVYSVNVNGRTYYEGIKFTGTSKNSYISYNVENVDNITFAMGHVDDTDRSNAKLSIYIDDVLYDKIDLWYGKMTEKYEIDTSTKSIVKFVLTRNDYSDSQYALVDFVVDGAQPSMETVVPTYETPENILDESYDNYNCTLYNAKSKAYSFNMNGRTYYQGIAFTGTSKYSYLSFNVENVDELSFTIGHIDNTGTARAALSIYLDDILYDEISLWSGKSLSNYTIDTSGKTIMKIMLSRNDYSDSQYAIADLTLDGVEPAMDKVIPEYETAEDLLNASFDNVYTKIYDNVSNVYSFVMNGVTYYQGLTFVGSSKISEATFNVENVGSLSFKLGPVEDSGTVTATLKIICDDYNAIEIPLTVDDETKSYVLDTSEFSTVKFYLQRYNYSTSDYAIADVAISSEAPDKNDPHLLELEFVKGDVNDDLCLNVFDIIAIRRMIFDNAEYDAAADLNNDGKISVADLVELYRFLLNY